MKTTNITTPAPGWFRINGLVPSSVLTESGHYVTGDSILIPVGQHHITPAQLVAIAITAVGDAPAKPALVKALEALTGTAEPVKRKRSPKEETGQPSEDQVGEPAVASTELPLAEVTTEGGAE